jgi:hypothetical protein
MDLSMRPSPGSLIVALTDAMDCCNYENIYSFIQSCLHSQVCIQISLHCYKVGLCTKNVKHFLPNAYFPLDLCVTEGTHDCPWFDIGTACCYVPGRHPHPQFEPSHYGWSIPQSKWSPCLHRFC